MRRLLFLAYHWFLLKPENVLFEYLPDFMDFIVTLNMVFCLLPMIALCQTFINCCNFMHSIAKASISSWLFECKKNYLILITANKHSHQLFVLLHFLFMVHWSANHSVRHSFMCASSNLFFCTFFLIHHTQRYGRLMLTYVCVERLEHNTNRPIFIELFFPDFIYIVFGFLLNLCS